MAQIEQSKPAMISRAFAILDHLLLELVKFREVLHQNPELSWNEFKTTERIIKFLKDHGIHQVERPLETGVIAEIVQKKRGKFIGFRADIDALPILDEKKVAYVSQNVGISHTCGHDVHTTVMLGLAIILHQLRNDLAGNLRFIFQPAEEPIPSGAPKMIEKGVLKQLETIWAMHVDPELPFGTVGLTEGWVNAQSIRIDWIIYGKGGHSARPHLAVDPIRPGTEIIQKIYQFVEENEFQKHSQAVFTFTRFKSNGAYNAIPASAEITATLRVTQPGIGNKILKEIREVNQWTEDEFNVSITYTVVKGAPPVTNDPMVIKKFLQTVKQSNDPTLRIETNYRSMGGDDFGWYTRKVPGALVRFGIAFDKNTAGLHTGMFDVPPDLIPFAIRFFLHQTLSW